MLSTNEFLAEKQQQINHFVKRANQHLPENDPLFFDGSFITGQTENPDILFIGINPGHRNWNDIESRKAKTRFIDYEPHPCKYIIESQEGNRFAKRVVDVVCGGDASKLEYCAETSLLSYFASPTESVVKAQIKQLSKNMQAEHEVLSRLSIDKINPKHIVCIGWRTFDRFMSLYNKGVEVPAKKLPIHIRDNEKMMDYYARTSVDGIPLHGIRHFSTPLTHAMLDDMKVIFSKVWKEIEQQ